MFLTMVESEGLAHQSYLIGDEEAGACAVIDPRRDVEVYLETARRHQARITHVLETHIHADFVSGSRELAARAGAEVCVGATGEYGFEHRPLREGDTVRLGAVTLRALHTPGHTPEHVCFVASGGAGASEPWGVFTGDTLFAGEVGRPDLLGEGTEERQARQLYHSLREKLLPLGDEIALYPAHGAGSPCGATIGERRESTLGYERRHNPALQARGEQAFVRRVLASLPEAPAYYPRMKKVNAAGPRVSGGAAEEPLVDPAGVEAAVRERGALVLDTRESDAFGGGHIPGALNIPLRKEFPIWAGWLLDPEQPLLLVTADPRDLETVRRHLLRVGIESAIGSLRRGMRGWVESGRPFERIGQMSVHALRERARGGRDGMEILDVRRDDEWESGHVPGALPVFLPRLRGRLGELDRERPVTTYCGSGYRAGIAASILRQAGFATVATVPGSMRAWKAAGFKTVRPNGRRRS